MLITQEVNDMPRKDGTGPIGLGAETGRGIGWCRTGCLSGKDVARGASCGMKSGIQGKPRRSSFKEKFGQRRGFMSDEQELLMAQRDCLEARIQSIDMKLENFKSID